jgi:hypothetical protein
MIFFASLSLRLAFFPQSARFGEGGPPDVTMTIPKQPFLCDPTSDFE